MNFIIAERDGLRLLIIEHKGYNEYWTLEIRRYTSCAYQTVPWLSQMNGMRIRTVEEKEFRAMLSNYEVARKMLKYMDETLPF